MAKVGGRPSVAPRPDRLRLRPSPTLRAALLGAFEAMVDYATREAATAKDEPERAVHEWRKSLRRSRALLRLLHGQLPRRDHDAISEILQRAQAAASDLRDADVLGPILEELANEAKPRVRHELAALEESLEIEPGTAHKTTRPSAATVLAPHVPRLRMALRRLARTLPKTIGWKALERALAHSYRRAERRYRRARGRKVDQRFHDLRKAIKVLHYQTELVASAADLPADRLRGKLGALAEAQGHVTDLLLVEAAVARLHPRSKTEPISRTQRALESFIARAIRRRRGPADRAAARLLGRSPRKVAHRLVEAVKARGEIPT